MIVASRDGDFSEVLCQGEADIGFSDGTSNEEGQVYVLTVDKAGPKIKVNDSPQDLEVPIKGGIDGTTIGTRVPMEYLCFWLGSIPLRLEERPVIDKTGLLGRGRKQTCAA